MLRQLITAQSAFKKRDLLNVARAVEPHARLERIYEWYFVRTMTAIRVAFGAAVAASAAIYGLVVKNLDPKEMQHRATLSRGLAVGAVVCVAAGVVQRRELAQLHREFAAASRLLSDLRLPAEDVSGASDGQRNEDSSGAPTSEWRKRRAIIGVVVAAASVIGIGVAIEWADTPARALTVVAILAPLLVAPHILAEGWSHGPPKLEPVDREDTSEPLNDLMGDNAPSLEQVVGYIRLDRYVLDPNVKTKVDLQIKKRPAILPGDQEATR